jgi:acyl dehydratase
MSDPSQTGEGTLRQRLDALVGKPFGPEKPVVAPDPVNVPMIRHWVAALEDHNPVYTDAEFAAKSRFGGIVAPPLMLQTWTMATPKLTGIAERGGSPVELEGENPLSALDEAGFVGILATNSEFEFERYLRPGDLISATNVIEAISEEKQTRLGRGYFVTWLTTYRDQRGEVVGRQRFRVFKFKVEFGASS